MELRIDELALRTGTSSRNIRAHQQRGLLPPPRLQGRTGFYNEDHVRRLELIRDLQERGFSLEAIRQTLDAWSQGGAITDLLGMHELLHSPWTDEEPVALTAQRLLELFPEVIGRPDLVQQAIDQGLLQAAEDGETFKASPVLIDSGARLVRAGIPMAEIFELVAAVRASTAQIAQRFVDLVADRLVEPISEGTASADEIREITDTVLALRGAAFDVVRPFLAQELASATEAALQNFRVRVESATDLAT